MLKKERRRTKEREKIKRHRVDMKPIYGGLEKEKERRRMREREKMERHREKVREGERR